MSIEVSVYDVKKQILFQKVGKDITVKDIENSTKVTFELTKGWKGGWKLILDLTENNIISPEAQVAVIAQQKAYIESGCLKVASIVPSAVKKLQQKRLQKEAANEIDDTFTTKEEAIRYLESL